MLARSTQWRGSTAPERRTLNFGSSATPIPLGACRSYNASYAAGPLARTCFGKMRVHHAPAAGFLAEHHGRAGDELVAAVVDILGWRRRAGPMAFGAAMAPDHGHVVGRHAAEVERCPVARLHVLSVEFPQPDPMLAPFVGLPIEVEEHRLGRRAPDRLELSPIEAGVGVDIVGVQLQDLLAVALRAADEIGHRHFLSTKIWNHTMGLSRAIARAAHLDLMFLMRCSTCRHVGPVGAAITSFSARPAGADLPR